LNALNFIAKIPKVENHIIGNISADFHWHKL